jgi:hypothetical protein
MRAAARRGESPALFTVAQVGTWRRDGCTWGWMGEEGWRYFRTQQDAEKFSETYQRLQRERVQGAAE